VVRVDKERLIKALVEFGQSLGRPFKEVELFRSIPDKIESVTAVMWASAKALREQGLLVRAFRVVNAEDIPNLRTPLVIHYQGRPGLLRQVDKDYVEIDFFENGVQSFPTQRWSSIWDGIAIGPIQPNILVEILQEQETASDGPIFFSIYRFCGEDKSLAQRLRMLCTTLIDQARAEGRPIYYLDELGGVPVEEVKARAVNGNEEIAYAKMLEGFRNELAKLEQGVASWDADIIYRTLYNLLAEKHVKGFIEELPYPLWKKIEEADSKRKDSTWPLKLFCLDRVEQAAAYLFHINKTYWDLNSWERDQNFLQQVCQLIASNPQALVITLRTGGHLGIEMRLPSLLEKRNVRLLVFALSECPHPEDTVFDDAQLYWNCNVFLTPEEVLEIFAKQPLLLAIGTFKASKTHSTQEKSIFKTLYETRQYVSQLGMDEIKNLAKVVALVLIKLKNNNPDMLKEWLNSDKPNPEPLALIATVAEKVLSS